MRINGIEFDWDVIETEGFKQLHDHFESKVSVVSISSNDNDLSFVVKISTEENGQATLGPGIVLSGGDTLGLDKECHGKRFYLRPKLTIPSSNGITSKDVEGLLQWLHSPKFRFIESKIYNYPSSND